MQRHPVELIDNAGMQGGLDHAVRREPAQVGWERIRLLRFPCRAADHRAVDPPVKGMGYGARSFERTGHAGMYRQTA